MNKIIIIKCNDDKEHLKNKKQMMFASRSISTSYRRSYPPRPEGPAAALELAGGPRASQRSNAIEQGDKPGGSDGKLMISRVRQLHGQNNELIYIQPFRSSLALPHVLHSRTVLPPTPNTHTHHHHLQGNRLQFVLHLYSMRKHPVWEAVKRRRLCIQLPEASDRISPVKVIS